MDHLAFSPHPQGQIEAGVELSLSTFTSGLAADPGHGDQGADEQGFVVQNLGQAGSRLAFLGRQVASVAHRYTSYLSDILYYIRQSNISQAFFECEFAQNGGLIRMGRIYAELSIEKI